MTVITLRLLRHISYVALIICSIVNNRTISCFKENWHTNKPETTVTMHSSPHKNVVVVSYSEYKLQQ